MSFLGERVSYLKGLAEGLKVDDSTDEGKLIKGIIDVLEDFALEIDEIEDSMDSITEHLDEVDEDLAQLEEDYYEDEYYYDDGYDDYEDKEFYDDEENSEELKELYEVDCPSCNKKILLEKDEISNTIICPYCDQEMDIEFEKEENNKEDNDEQ